MSNKLAESRKEAGYTQCEVARALNTTTRTVIRWEKGEYEPNSSHLKKMSHMYGKSIDFLLESNPS